MQLDKHERNKLIGKILKSTNKDYIISPSVNDIADEIIKSGDSDLMKLLPQNVRNKYANKILNYAIK